MKTKHVTFFAGLLVSILALCLNLPAFAAVPKLMTYQGILKDSAGNYLTGNYVMTFRVFDALTAGNQLWSETQSAVPVTSGRFSAQLGSVTPLGLSFSQDYWLSIQVGTDAEMTPRQKITSVGYAYMADQVVNGFTQGQHDQLSHMNISGVRAAHTSIARTNFKLDAYTRASANSMGDLIVDTFNDASGIDTTKSTSYVWRGTPNYDVTAIPPPSGIDANTALILHMNGANGSTAFTDSAAAPKTVTAAGNAKIDTAQSQFGGASGLFDGTGDYLSAADHADFDFSTKAFTIDAWIRVNSFATDVVIASQGNDASNYWKFFVDSGGELRFQLYSAGSIAFNFPGAAGQIAPNVWYHVMITQRASDGLYEKSLNGVGQGERTGATIPNYTGNFYIGKSAAGSADEFDGRIDELRVSKISRWGVSDFTPPTQEYAQVTSGTPATVISPFFTELTVPKEVLVIADETLNAGTVTYYISRDDGVTWTQSPKDTVTNIDAQPSGTRVRWKAVITGDAELDAFAVAV